MKFLYKFPTLLFALTLFIGIQAGMAQTNPSAQTLPINQNFGTTSFSSLPAGFAAWNGVNGNSITTQALAEQTAPTGDASFTARTSTTTTAGIYGLSIDSNGRVYIQTSSNATNGVNQLALAINTTGKENVRLSFDIRLELKGDANRPVGVVAQYRVGTEGSWTTISGSAQEFTSESNGTVVSKTNLSLGSNANNQSVVQIRWAIWRGSGSGSSGGLSVDNVGVTGDDIAGDLPPSVSALSVDQVTSNSAFLSSSVTSDGGQPVTSRGFVYAVKSQNEDPLIGGANVTSVTVGSGTGAFNQTISGLESSQIYTAKAFATNSEGTTYSATVDFTTFAELTLNGYTQTFSSFNSASTIPLAWDLSNETYIDTWGSGVSAGLRGNASVLGFQLTGGTTSFSATVTLQNNTGETINHLAVGYTGRAERLDLTGRLPEWVVEVNGVEVEALAYSTASAVDINADKEIFAVISGLNIANGEQIEIEWSTTYPSGSGASRQIGISDVSVSKAIQASASLTHQSEGFRLLSTPVPSTFATLLDPIWTQGAAGADVSNGSPNVWLWDNTSTTDGNENWQPVADLGDDIATANGFLVYVFENDIFGDNDSNTWPKVLTVTGVEHGLPAQPSLNDNQNALTLLGNPTSSRLSWSEIFDASSGLQNAVYVYDPASGWLSNVAGEDLGDLTDGVIAPFQGFFVQALDVAEPDPSVSITSDALVGSGGAFYGKQTQQEPLALRLQLDGNGFSNGTWFSFNESASEGRDRRDALQLAPLSQSFAYMASRIEDGTLLSINNLPLEIDDQITFPLTVQASRGGEFTISVDRLNLPEGVSVTITDRENGTRFELTSEASYTFTIGGGTAPKTSGGLTTPGGILATAADDRFEITFSSNPVSVEPRADLPQVLALEQNYPNPFNPTTGIRFELPSSQFVNLAVYDLLGRRVAMLVNEDMSAGSHFVNFDASALSSGVYVYRLEAGGQVLTRKMTLLK